MKFALLATVLSITAFCLSSCSSAQKARQAEREKVAAVTGFYCDFVNGDEFKDAEVALNLTMAKRCDPAKPFSMTGYKNASEIHGIVYCCSTIKKEAHLGSAPKPSHASAEPHAAGKDEKTGDKPATEGGEGSAN